MTIPTQFLNHLTKCGAAVFPVLDWEAQFFSKQEETYFCSTQQIKRTVKK